MRKQGKGELIFIGIIILYTLVYFFADIAPLHSQTKSKAFVILIMAVLIGLLAVQIIIMLTNKEFLKSIRFNTIDMVHTLKTPLLYLTLCTVAYLALIPLVGFFVTTFIYIDVILWFSGIRKKLLLFVVPFIYDATMFYAFDFLLNVRFPRGFLF